MMNGISSYSLWWIIAHRDLYLYHGDLDYLKEQQSYLTPLIRQILSKIRPDGKENLDGGRFLDWLTANNEDIIHSGLQSLTVMAMVAGKDIAGWLNDKELGKRVLSVGFETLDRYLFKPEECYDKLAATGIKWARCQTGWNRCETEKGKYDFAWLDEVVNNLLERGIQPWFNVTYGNKLYMPEAFGEAAVGWVPIYFGEETQKACANFVRALATHFKGRVTHYEIWNEANIPIFWQPGEPNAVEYLNFIAGCNEIIKGINPNAKIGANIEGLINQYLVDLIQSGVSKYIDFFPSTPIT